MSASTTRKQTNVWLIGYPEPVLPNNVLPTISDVLKTYFYHHTTNKITVPMSLKLTAEDLFSIWEKAHIPTTFKPHIISKMKSVVEEYILLKKNKARVSQSQKLKEKLFSEKIEHIFDIAHKDWENLIKIEEDKIFLSDQRGLRKMIMGAIDKDLLLQEERVNLRKDAEESRKLREAQRKSTYKTITEYSDSSDDNSETSNEDTDENNDYEIEIPTYYRNIIGQVEFNPCQTGSENSQKRSRLVMNMLTSPDVSATLDRINLSDKKFTILAATIARANGENLNENSLSRSTIRRKRTAHRAALDTSIREAFMTSEKRPLIVHWDGKLMKDTTNEEYSKSNINRLAVVVSGYNVDKILGVMKNRYATGYVQAKTVFDLLVLWDVVDEIIGMSFDTTASNTGVRQGTATILEIKMKKQLLYFACRHHVYEIIVAEIFKTLFGPSTGPNIALFQRFQNEWQKINKENYKSLDEPWLGNSYLTKQKEVAVAFLQNILTTETAYMPREDYKEIVELSLIILGVLPRGKPYHFRTPGAYHMARWMSKIIYCYKMYLFRNEFEMLKKEEENLTQFCLFTSIIYVKFWITCPIASDAPVNDLELFKQIKKYSDVNETISNVAIKKFKSHLWYLSPEMIPLSLFSNKLTTKEKREIIRYMKIHGNDWSVRERKLKDCEALESKTLHDLVSPASAPALHALRINVDFIFKTDPEKWQEIPNYKEALNVVSSLKVVNDCAERSVALMSKLNESITKKESEMQKLIQVVEEHRKRVPNTRKSTLATYNPQV